MTFRIPFSDVNRADIHITIVSGQHFVTYLLTGPDSGKGIIACTWTTHPASCSSETLRRHWHNFIGAAMCSDYPNIQSARSEYVFNSQSRLHHRTARTWFEYHHPSLNPLPLPQSWLLPTPFQAIPLRKHKLHIGIILEHRCSDASYLILGRRQDWH
jgi:hypothetical protein